MDPVPIDARIAALWTELTAPGAAYEVTTVEVDDVPLRAFARAPATLAAVWAGTAAHGERACLVFEGERLSYAQAHAAVEAAAAWLHGVGVRAGDRVAIAMRNYPEWLLAYWACLRSGISAVGMNAWWTADEMAFAIRDAAPRAIVCDAERLERLYATPGLADGMAVVAARAPARAGATPWEEVAAMRGRAPVPDIGPDDDACVFYTSGTTGTPKGARLTHRGCVNNLMTLAFAGELHARAAGVEAVTAPPVGLATTPLFHVTANNCLAHPIAAAGGTLVLMRKWDAGEAARLIERERITNFSGVPTMVRELLCHPDAASRDLSSLQLVSGGGAQLQPDLVEAVPALAGDARPSTGYGMTEACGIIAGVNGPAYLARPDSCGRIMPTFEARLVDDDGRAVAAGAVGELLIRGAGVIAGYLNRPDATAEAISDGWLRTGDVARLNAAGYLYLVDRKKDMVLRGGENVYCAEVEAALFRHPAVAEACVFGVPDARLGEEVGAIVHPRGAVTADELRRFVGERIAAYKVPRHLWLTDAPLPRNASGKPLRRELRARYAGQNA